MQQHVKLVAILNIVYGSIWILLGLVVFALLGGVGFLTSFEGRADAEQALPILVLIAVFIFGILLIVSAPAIVAGVGLLYYRPWARVLTIVVSALHLLNVPFGTALGIYGLWALLKPETEAMFRGLPPAAVPARPHY